MTLPGIIFDGKKITAPGIYAGIPLDDPLGKGRVCYHGDLCDGHSVSHGGLERVLKSPKHYFDKWYGNPDREEDKPKEPMILGRAAHHLHLGERSFTKHFIRRPTHYPAKDGTRKPWIGSADFCKEWLEAQATKGLTVITEAQTDALIRMSKSLAAEPLIQMGLLNGHVEQSFVIKDRETGLWLKGRPDVVPNDVGDYVDLKTTADITEDGLQRAIYSMGYHRQAALVLEIAAMLTDAPLRFRDPGSGEGFSWTLVFVESDRPHCVEIVHLKPDDLAAGQRDNRLALRLLARCIEKNEWPGPSFNQREGRYLGRTPWQIERDDYRAKVLERMLAVG